MNDLWRTGQVKSPQRELLLKHILHIISHLIMRFDIPGTVYDGFLFRFGKLCKTVQNIRVLCQFHRKADGKLFVIYHMITPMVGCAEMAGNIREIINTRRI